MSTAVDTTQETTFDTSEIATYRKLFDNQYDDLEQLLADLPSEALLWKPFEQSPWQGPSSLSTFSSLIAAYSSGPITPIRQ